MKKTSIIGAGRLGTTLGYSLSKKGFKIISVSCRTLLSAKNSVDLIGQGIPMSDNKKAVKNAEIVMISVPDDHIKNVVNELSSINLNQKFIFHCSGLISSKTLSPLKKSGAVTASLHPIQSFPKKSRDLNRFKNIYFSIEGDKKAQKISNMIIKKLGSRSFVINPEDKPLYHTACTIASNYLVVIMGLAENLLEKVGVKKEVRDEMLFPLVKGTLNNITKKGIPGSLTGPISRGDIETLKSHLNCLKNYPSILRAYKELAQQGLETASKENRLSQNEIREIKALLE